MFGATYGFSNVTIQQQTNITPTGFSVQFQSTVNGHGVVKYGTSQNPGTVLLGSQIFSLTHEIELDGLESATLYFLRAGVILAPGDTLYSDLEPMMTASLSSGDIKVYFNSGVDTTEATTESAISLGQNFPDTIKAYLNRAKFTLDITAYNIDNQNGVIDAINAAYNRGVQVRFVGNFGISDWNYDAIQIGTGNKIKSPDGNAPSGGYYGLMHNKFIVIDANSSDPNDPVVITGSTNFTNNQLRNDPNNLIIFQDQSIARGFTVEFEELFGGTFGPEKSVKTPKEFVVGGKKVEVHFSPKSGVENVLVNYINNVQHDFYFGIFTHTRATISQTIANRISDGIFVAGIFGQIDTEEPEYTILANSMGNSLFIDALPWSWHHKYAIFDPNCPEGYPMIYTGSANWSNNGNIRSDENVVIVHDSTMANLYFQEFMHRYKGNGGNLFVQGDCTLVSTLAENEANDEIEILIFPNPNHGEFWVQSKAGSGELRLFSTTGNIVHRQFLQPEEEVGLAHLSPGLYLLHFTETTAQRTVVKKIVVQ